MIDRDLALLYGVETKRLNEQVKRNIERFPEDFMFQLTNEECSRSQIATLNTKQGQNIKYKPYAFTENGIAMLSSILRSETAIAVNIRIMRTFTKIRKTIFENFNIENRVELIDNYIDETVLTLLDKRPTGAEAVIYTSRLSKQLQLDIDKHNAQYPPIEVKTFNKAHDRFLIIDDKVYLVGASIKDLGKKWFGFTLMENTNAKELLERL